MRNTLCFQFRQQCLLTLKNLAVNGPFNLRHHPFFLIETMLSVLPCRDATDQAIKSVILIGS
ncbi:hypothetical protein BK662_31680 [Pseudomonas frederiksbergensis]|uniref:Uncharacterized protein n=1 Tax=Pseudomonas frederiksbergensis TaxID=104087 RepID=A0A423HF47_9PSED|nr:hypothetical protein BK662_31680 [Pseudomonas frederiksbergensis]